jgi:selenocysteine lyase/cysteine desulfurase
MSCGFAILSDKGKEWLPLVFGGNGLNSKDAFVGADLPERYESGTLPVLSIAGLSAGVDHVLSIDFNEKQDRYRSLISTFINDISDNGNLKIYHAESGCPIISITHDRIDAENIAEYLWKNGIAVRAGLHCAPLAHQAIGTADGGTVRFSMSEFNTINDCKYVASLLSKLK